MEKKKRHPILKTVFFSFLISVFLAALVIFSVNEVFALAKKEEEISVVLPMGVDTGEVADILSRAGVLKVPSLFRLYAGFRSWDDTYLTGEFVLNRAMSYDEIHAALKPKKGVRNQIRILIPEGYNTDEIISLFVSMGIGTREKFIDTIQNGGDFGYSFVRDIPQKEGRRYRLDGYLFPDTYFVYADSTEEEIIKKLLSNFNKKFDESMREEAAKAGYSVDDIVTLSSLVEKEAYFPSDMGGIASVFYNRLHDTRYPFLQSDATVAYAGGGTFTPDDIDNLDSPYNTYRKKGLPPGPIASPGLAAIEAALRPDDTPYYYFVTGKNKSMIFSKTYAEHLKAIASLRS